jgi:drug/metabolite transporter (DMT)-like permease
VADRSPPRGRLLLAFAAVYLIWGSTYLAIRIAIETLPPLIMAGTRFMFAGTLLFAWSRWRGAPSPSWRHWRSAAVVGGFMLLGGNGGVVWAEQRVPSGLAALLIATVPLWMVMLAWGLRQGPRPTGRVALGLVFGITGVTWLVSARGSTGNAAIDPVGAGVLVLAALAWAFGSLRSRHAVMPKSPFLATGMQMIAGGALQFLAGLARGEWGRFDPGAVSLRSGIALVYLMIFGSLIGFTAYLFLLRTTTPARASTYAFVNPVVAVFLGWLLAGEVLTPRTLGAAAVILIGVTLLVTTSQRPATQQAPEVLPARSAVRPLPDALDAG